MAERAFVKWASKHRVLFPKLGFDDLPCCGRSVITTTPIAAGDVVVTVGAHVWLPWYTFGAHTHKGW